MEKLIDLSGHSYYIVERKLFDNAIYQAAVDRGVHDFTGHALIDAAFNEDVLLWDLILNNHSGSAFALQAKALIGADGAGSRVRRITGLKLNKDKHMAVGIRAYARAAGMDQSALRFDYPVHLIPGYGWTFPLLDHKVNIGVGLDRRDFKAIGKTLHSHLQDYVDYLADIGIIIKDVRGFSTHPLPLAYPELPLVPQRQVALIGDAANMIDPFTGEGIHYGIWAGFELGRMVSEGWQQHTIQFAMERYAKTYADKFSGTMDDAQTLRTNARFFRMFC